MKEILENFPKQCQEALKLGEGIKVRNNIDKVIITGMGGSGFVGDVLKAIVDEELNILINKDYFLPKDINRNTLVFVVSYSGNTEESLYAMKDAIKKGCKIIGVSSDGQLEKICKRKKIDFIEVPEGIQPRNATGYQTISVIMVLQENKLIRNRDKELKTMVEELKNKKIQSQGKEIANLLFNKIPIIYSSERLKCISYGFKTRINENSKVLAFANQIPELHHNEITGYTHAKKIGNFYTIIIRDKDDFIRVKKRFLITEKIIKKYNGECTIIDTLGSNLISRIFSTLHLADWASYYLALKYKIDPAPVKLQEFLKKELKK